MIVYSKLWTKGTKAVVSGWGSTDVNSQSATTRLRATAVTIEDINQCKNEFPPNAIADRMLCAAGGEHDACNVSFSFFLYNFNYVLTMFFCGFIGRFWWPVGCEKEAGWVGVLGNILCRS